MERIENNKGGREKIWGIVFKYFIHSLCKGLLVNESNNLCSCAVSRHVALAIALNIAEFWYSPMQDEAMSPAAWLLGLYQIRGYMWKYLGNTSKHHINVKYHYYFLDNDYFCPFFLSADEMLSGLIISAFCYCIMFSCTERKITKKFTGRPNGLGQELLRYETEDTLHFLKLTLMHILVQADTGLVLRKSIFGNLVMCLASL